MDLNLDPMTPVLVGIGTATQHVDDPNEAVEAIELMGRAGRAAIADAGGVGVAEAIDWIGVPEGTWGYRDPGRLLMGALGTAAATRTVVADVGILQQSLIDHALAEVSAGRARVALVVGGEAKFRGLRAAITDRPAPEIVQADDVVPDERLSPGSLAAVGVIDLEIIRNTVSPVTAYALIENAIAHDLGRTPAEHRDAVAALWARFATVAAANPEAWDRTGPDAAAIRDAGAGNRMISFPYTKRHCAQWNVDQAAALLVCTVGTADALGVPPERRVFAHASAVANHAAAVAERAAIGSCAGADLAAARVLELAGRPIDEIAHVDLYSCFPSAVERLAAALGLPLDDPARPLTVTGGLTFAGGPLNNYVLQALVVLVRRLRADPGSFGLSTSVSGFLVKQGFSIWSTDAPRAGFRRADVTAETATATETVEVVDLAAIPDAAAGPAPAAAAHAAARPAVTATIASWTVDFAAGDPSRAVVIADLAGEGVERRRTIVESRELTTIEALLAADPVGRVILVRGGEFTI